MIGCDAGTDRSFSAHSGESGGPPLWRFLSRSRSGKRHINIFQVLMHAGMVNSAASDAAQRTLADVMLKPPLENIDLLDWQAFDRAIAAGYECACRALEGLPDVPRLSVTPVKKPAVSSLALELERRLAAKAARAG